MMRGTDVAPLDSSELVMFNHNDTDLWNTNPTLSYRGLSW